MRWAALLVTAGLLACSGDDNGNANGGANNANPGNGTTPAGPTTTVGPSLDGTPGLVNTFGCSAGFPVQTNPTFPQPFLGAGQGSCLVLTFLAPTGPALHSGTAVSATIRVPGATTGPMRFVRMRILYNRTQTPKCCSLEQYGDVFTPQAGTTTTVPLNFPMTLDPTPAPDDLTTIAANDIVALEVLSPNVPIPGVWTQNGGPQIGTASYMWLPALSAAQTPAPSNQILQYQGSYSGFVPLFNVAFTQ